VPADVTEAIRGAPVPDPTASAPCVAKQAPIHCKETRPGRVISARFSYNTSSSDSRPLWLFRQRWTAILAHVALHIFSFDNLLFTASGGTN